MKFTPVLILSGLAAIIVRLTWAPAPPPPPSPLGLFVGDCGPGAGVYLLAERSQGWEDDVVAIFRFDRSPDWIPLEGVLEKNGLQLRHPSTGPWVFGTFVDGGIELQFPPHGDSTKEGRSNRNVAEIVRERLHRPYHSAAPTTISAVHGTTIRLNKVGILRELQIREQGLEVRCLHPELLDGPFRSVVEEGRAEAETRARSAAEQYRNWIREEGLLSEPLDYGESWSVEVITREVISLMSFVSDYSGGNHPNYDFRTKTFWVSGNQVKEARLADLFNPCAPWQEELSARVLQQLREAEASWIVDGAIPFLNERKMRNWNLTPLGIEIRFPPYWVGCYADGSFLTFVSFDELRGLLNPIGPAGEFLR